MKQVIAGCPSEKTLHVLGGRWKIYVLARLFDGTMRFSELQQRINALTDACITPKMLTHELRQMEAAGLVHRKVYAEVPPKVEYSLTPLGMSLRPIVTALTEWGRNYESKVE